MPIWFPELNGRVAYLPPRHSFCNACDSTPSAVLILSALITGNSSLDPLLEGLLAQIHIDLS